MTDLYLCSFASPDLSNSVERFINQSKEIGLYKSTKIFSWIDLTESKKNQINYFFKKNNKRLYGYACWKPEIILSNLNSIPKGSILQYSDIGCHLNKNGYERLGYYLDLMNDQNILAFQYYEPKFQLDKKLKYQIYFEKEYTKNDLFNYLEVKKDSDIRNSEQIWSGSMFFKHNEETKNFLNKWLEVCNINSLIDDTPSNDKNCDEFIEHRHDQSAFSILCKLNNINCLSASECEWAEDENGRYWRHLNNYPILAKRDKKLNLVKRFFLRQCKNIRRIFNK